MSRRTLLLGALLTIACTADEALAPPGAASLVGTWTTTPERVSPQGSWQRTIQISRDGRVALRGTTRGLYPGQAADDVSAEVTLFGRIALGPGAFLLRADSIVTRDTFHGPASRTVQRDVPPPSPNDSTHYVVRGDSLVLTYVTYPADAPVLTTEILIRRD